MSEDETVGKRRMTVEPELDKGRRIRIGQIDFAEHLKGVGCDFGRVRHDAVDNLEAKDVGLMFLRAAESVGHRIKNKHQNLKDQQNNGQRGPILSAVNFPPRSPAMEQPMEIHSFP